METELPSLYRENISGNGYGNFSDGCLLGKNIVFLCKSKHQTRMTYIANPIYDIVFKFLMEDERVARVLLSALLKKEIVHLEMRQHEYTSMQQTRISLFRIDFAARVREKDGTEQLILIELQKTWLITETLRFRQYLGTQYLDEKNMVKEENDSSYGLPIVSIYILGHKVGDLTEPIIYVHRRYLDYDDQVIEQRDRFIESLTHDSIIVQIPYLKGRMRNHLERLLTLFDQDYRAKEDDHLLEINENNYYDEEKLLVNRLLRAASAPDIRRAMQVEDEILSEIEARDTTIMVKNEVIKKKDQVIEEKDQVIEENEQRIEEQSQMLKEKEQAIKEKERMLEEKSRLLDAMVRMLRQEGKTPEEIATRLSLPIEDIRSIF